MDGRSFPSELGRRRRGGARCQLRIAAGEGREDVGDWDIDGRPAVADVLHVAPAADIVGLEERVLPPVELERADAELLAEAPYSRDSRRGPCP